MERVNAVSSLAGAWATQTLSYRLCAVSVLGYVMQFVQLPKDIVHYEASCIAKVLKIPRNAIPSGIAQHLDLFRLPAFPSLQHLATATMARAWMSLSRSNEAEVVLNESSNSDDRRCIDPVKEWEEKYIVVTMRKVYHSVHSIEQQWVPGSKPVQAIIYAALRGVAPMDTIVGCVANRMLTIVNHDHHSHDDMKVSVNIAMQHIKATSEFVQPSAVQAWTKGLFNAWTTSRRFGGEVRRCPFCFAPNGDSLQHYSSCAPLSFYGAELIPQLWAHGYRMQCVVSFLGADAKFEGPPQLSSLLAAWTDAVHWASLAHTRGYFVESPIQTLASRLKVFLLKFCKGADTTKVMVEAIHPSAASLAAWS